MQVVCYLIAYINDTVHVTYMYVLDYIKLSCIYFFIFDLISLILIKIDFFFFFAVYVSLFNQHL